MVLTLLSSGLRRLSDISTPSPTSRLDKIEAFQASELLGGQSRPVFVWPSSPSYISVQCISVALACQHRTAVTTGRTVHKMFLPDSSTSCSSQTASSQPHAPFQEGQGLPLSLLACCLRPVLQQAVSKACRNPTPC